MGQRTFYCIGMLLRGSLVSPLLRAQERERG